MSWGETYSAATASVDVSPGATVTSTIGPQLVGVIAPLNEPTPARATPEKTPNASAATRTRRVRTPERIATSPIAFCHRAAARAALATGSGVTRKPDF